VKTTTYTIHRGTVRSSFALYHHTMAIYRRHTWANEALGKATLGLVEAEKHTAGVEELVVKYGSDGLYGKALTYAQREQAARSVELRAAQSELKNATARADEASKMHITPFVPTYIPTKASRVFPALKTCTSPRRAAIARQRSRREHGIITGVSPKDVRVTVNGREVKGFAAGDDIRVETSVGYTAR
jgi:hypothetical protein